MSSTTRKPRPLRLVRNLTNARFFWLLAFFVAFILVGPWLPASSGGVWERGAILASVIVAAVYAGRGGRGQMLITIILAITFLVGLGVELAFPGCLPPLLVPVVVLATLLFTTFCILVFVLDTGTISADHIYGAICAYIMIALIFAGIYGMIETACPGSFNGLNSGMQGARPWLQFLYLSFSTLSTVGFGDITPVTPQARSISICQQLVGTFYVAILIARLAGLYPPRSAEDDEEKPS